VLHDHNIIHRNIKPANLNIENYNPPRKFFIDFDQNIQKTTVKPTPKFTDTIEYLTPEKEITTYTKNIDIWTIAIIGVQIFITKGKLP
jgi:serine/threonine protein kinase